MPLPLAKTKSHSTVASARTSHASRTDRARRSSVRDEQSHVVADFLSGRGDHALQGCRERVALYALSWVGLKQGPKGVLDII